MAQEEMDGIWRSEEMQLVQVRERAWWCSRTHIHVRHRLSLKMIPASPRSAGEIEILQENLP